MDSHWRPSKIYGGSLGCPSHQLLCTAWYFAIPVLLAGYLKNEEVSVDASFICNNILGWTMMAAYGFNVPKRFEAETSLAPSNFGLLSSN
ncbi:protein DETOXIFICATION 31-like [Cornus florida]|uniref:protein DETOXIFICATION 31-like n=1 Tax=Cornus florida TaxID=4283 RepID=UPI0028996695|nr:protein DETOXIFICATION 31-like [Cornus florida]